jgi:hypothetical protein
VTQRTNLPGAPERFSLLQPAQHREALIKSTKFATNGRASYAVSVATSSIRDVPSAGEAIVAMLATDAQNPIISRAFVP